VKRALAVLVAVGLVVGAFVLRGRLDGGGDGGPEPSGGQVAEVVACVDEVVAECQVVTGDVARPVTAGEALDALAADPMEPDDAEVDAWVLPRFVVDAVAAERARQGAPPAFGEVSEPIAHTEVVPAGLPDRVAALEAACGRPLDWACLAELAGRPWSDLGQPFPGVVRLGLDPPSSSATGLVALGALASAALGPFDPNQTDAQSWLQDLERNRLADPPRGQGALAVLATRAGTYDVAAALLADARQVAEANPRVGVARPAPAAVFEVVVASGAGRDLDRALVEDLSEELARSGWEEGEPPAGLVPAGDVLSALRNISGR
jgi:hypothetical protein